MVARILRTEQDRTAWVNFLAAQPLPLTVSAVKGAKRSLPQNATAAMWYGQIAAETGDTQADVKATCKLRFGKPIMERDNIAWVHKWHALYAPLPYAMQVRLFEAIPVTSQFTTRQMAEYMDAVGREYRAQGIRLIDPDDLRYAAEMKA